jgi:hypothetical protein
MNRFSTSVEINGWMDLRDSIETQVKRMKTAGPSSGGLDRHVAYNQTHLPGRDQVYEVFSTIEA